MPRDNEWFEWLRDKYLMGDIVYYGDDEEAKQKLIGDINVEYKMGRITDDQKKKLLSIVERSIYNAKIRYGYVEPPKTPKR